MSPIIKYTILIIALCSIPAFIALNYFAGEVISPKRAKIQSYQQDIIDAPENYGMSLTFKTCVDGQVPCVIAEPNPNFEYSRKGTILRNQLSEVNPDWESPLYPENLPTDQQKKAHSTVIILQGKNSNKETFLSVAERFCAAGFRCIIPDLPAHGASSIKKCQYGAGEFERQIPQLIFNELADAGGYQDQPVHLWGMSMGGSFLAYAAAEKEALQQPNKWSSLTVLCSFGSLETVLDSKTPSSIRGLFKSVLKLRGFDIKSIKPIDVVGRIETPLLMMHGTEDALIPLAQGEVLFEAYGSKKKQFISVPDAGHANILTTPMPLYAKMVEFMLENGRSK
ncbi:alpha/beta fold hydrolase [Akkermansiaceae bacterium]|nr:alpha/beta fold hydrolase [Akkermansiaceae bacterium]